jgi:transposase
VLLQALADGSGGADTLQMIDSTIIRAHHCAAGAKGDSESGSWPLARWLLDQIDVRTNGDCLPIGVVLTPGEAHDSTAYPDLMAERDSDLDVLLADRGYDSDPIRDDVRASGGRPEIPTKRNRSIQHSADHAAYIMCNCIERFISRPKNSSRVAAR